MTVSTETSTNTFQGDGSTTTFSTNIYGTNEEDFIVKRVGSSGGETTLTLSVDYNISDVDDASGVTVSYPISGPALPSGEELVITRDLDYTQELSLSPVAAFLPKALEKELDRQVMMIQQLNDGVGGSVARAKAWAENPEDTEVVPGGFSAFHHAAKAEEHKTGAQAAETGAQAAESSAETARTQAELAATAAGATLYDSIASGLSGTSDGDVFLVATTPGVQVYRNDAGSETPLGWLGEVLFDDVSALLADTGSNYAAGKIIRTRKKGFA